MFTYVDSCLLLHQVTSLPHDKLLVSCASLEALFAIWLLDPENPYLRLLRCHSRMIGLYDGKPQNGCGREPGTTLVVPTDQRLWT